MITITPGEALELWRKNKPFYTRRTDYDDTWHEVNSDTYEATVLLSENNEFAARQTVTINGKTVFYPDSIGVESDNGLLLHFERYDERLEFLNALSLNSEVLIK